jgi:hypothetical protein
MFSVLPFCEVMPCSLTEALGLLFYPENGGSNFLQNISKHLLDYMVLHPRLVIRRPTVQILARPLGSFLIFLSPPGKMTNNSSIRT